MTKQITDVSSLPSKPLIGCWLLVRSDYGTLILWETKYSFHFQNKALLMQLGPKECIVQLNDNSADAIRLREVIQRSGVLITERKKGKNIHRDFSLNIEMLKLSLPSFFRRLLHKRHSARFKQTFETELRKQCNLT